MYEELVKRLRERSVFLFPHHGESRNYDADLMHEAADAIEVLSKKETTTPRWISVEERLPEPYVEVLLYSGGERYTGYMHNDKRFTVNASHYPSRPTYWMPLPEPPKEET